ncbi:hypothetical protein [Sphingosinicella sp.]|uniref:hypothetical protein n=1 Tax=Sphingosinicella sp. TaxID=1917971 RepID=UPI0040378E16
MTSLEERYRGLKARWREGERDREPGLELLFLAWWHWAEPPFLTDLTDDEDVDTLWHEVFAHLGGERSDDVEFLFVAGIMAEVGGYVLGIDERWRARGRRMIDRAMAAKHSPLSESTFDNRGEYGNYFAHQLRGQLRPPEITH